MKIYVPTKAGTQIFIKALLIIDKNSSVSQLVNNLSNIHITEYKSTMKRKKKPTDTQNNIDEFQKYYAKWKKSRKKRFHIL